MTGGNFNWFLHTMLFYHTQQVIKKQTKGKGRGREEEEEGEEEEEENAMSDSDG